MSSIIKTESLSPSIYSDNASLDRIRQKAVTDSPAAIKAAAKEFESFFMNMMLKSMRQASEVIGDDSLISSSQEKMFVGMLDEQMSVDMSQKGTLGIAELITRNLLPKENLGFDVTGPRQQQKINSISSSSFLVNPEQNEISIPSRTGEISDELLKKVESSSANLPKVNLKNKNVPKENNLDGNLVPSKKSMFSSVASFVSELMPLASKAAEKIGLDPKVLLAQAALETGWGKHVIHDSKGKPSFNLFGIKDGNNWNGKSVKINTLEVESGEFVKQQSHFRAYDSFENSFNDFVEFVSENPRYQKAMSLVHDAKQFVQSIQDAGYATDPNYANKIINIFNRNLNEQ